MDRRDSCVGLSSASGTVVSMATAVVSSTWAGSWVWPCAWRAGGRGCGRAGTCRGLPEWSRGGTARRNMHPSTSMHPSRVRPVNRRRTPGDSPCDERLRPQVDPGKRVGRDPVDSSREHRDAADPQPSPCPRPRAGRARLAQHRRRAAVAGEPARPGRRPRLLDVLLRQLPARARRAAPGRGRVRRLRRRRRRALAEVRARGRPGRAGRRRRAVRGPPPRPRRPGAAHLAGLRRTGLAHARRRRPRGLRRRPAVRRGPRPRPADPARRARRGARAPRARCAAATARTCRRPAAATVLRFPGKVLPLHADGGTTLLVTDSAPPPPRRARRRRDDRACAPSAPASAVCSTAVRTPRVRRAAGPGPAAGRGRGPGRLRRRRRRHRQPRPARAAARRRHLSRWRARASSCASGRAAGRPSSQPLSTPWDVAWFDGQVVVAMAGLHQLWAFDPAPDPRTASCGCWPGRRRRGSATAPPSRRGSRRRPASRCRPTGAAVARRLRDQRAALARARRRGERRRPHARAGPRDPVVTDTAGQRAAAARPGTSWDSIGTGCSTSATSTARRPRPGSSTRWGSASLAGRLGRRRRHLQRRASAATTRRPAR